MLKPEAEGKLTKPDLDADPVSYPGLDANTVAVTTPLLESIPETVYVCPLEEPDDGEIVYPGTDAVHVYDESYVLVNVKVKPLVVGVAPERLIDRAGMFLLTAIV
jgi:hypothetical protein